MAGDRVEIVEVGPRDGLQNERTPVSVAARVALIDGLAAAGLPVVEAGAFVSPKKVPQMAATAEVLAALAPAPGVRFPVLVPNLKGWEAAVACGVGEIAVFGAASESFSQRNIDCSIAESLERFRPVCDAALASGVRVRGYVSCVLGCPYEGAVAPAAVAAVTEKLLALGCAEISLGDTIGVGTIAGVHTLLDAVLPSAGAARTAVHFHDTWGQALANVSAALERDIRIVDSAIAGLGGCPYARGASGNLATEDLLLHLHGRGMETGVDPDAAAAAGRRICEALGRAPAGKAAQAMAAQADA